MARVYVGVRMCVRTTYASAVCQIRQSVCAIIVLLFAGNNIGDAGAAVIAQTLAVSTTVMTLDLRGECH